MSLCPEAGAGAARGKTVLALEGSCQLAATASSAPTLASVMLGEAAPAVAPASGDGIDQLVRALRSPIQEHRPLPGA